MLNFTCPYREIAQKINQMLKNYTIHNQNAQINMEFNQIRDQLHHRQKNLYTKKILCIIKICIT